MYTYISSWETDSRSARQSITHICVTSYFNFSYLLLLFDKFPDKGRNM